MKRLLPAAILAMAPVAALAVPDVSIELNVARMFRADGVTPLPTNSLMTLLADVDGDGFGDLTSGKLLPDLDDRIIATFGSNGGNPIPLVDPGTPGAHTNDIIVFDETGLVTKPILLVWYDTPFDPAKPFANVGGGIAFGTYRTDEIINGSNFAWVVPGPGSAGSLNVLLPEFFPGSLLSAADLTASQSTVPEPATLAMLVVAATCLLPNRRRRAL